MRLPWSRSKNGESAGSAQVNKSEAALAGSAGDGKVHDLQYWLDSGFLTLPKVDSDAPVPVDSDAPVPVDSDGPVPVDSDAPVPVDSDAPVPVAARTSGPRPSPSSGRLAPDG